MTYQVRMVSQTDRTDDLLEALAADAGVSNLLVFPGAGSLIAEHATTPSSPAAASSSSQAAIAPSQGHRSSSVTGTPAAILAGPGGDRS
jgi:hypothetical protein